jgi:uncharacterized protein (TIGR02001 family)
MKLFARRLAFISITAFTTFAAMPGRAAVLDDAAGTWTISPAITSHYLFRGVELAGPSFQPWIDYSKGPLSVGVWSSFALEDRVSGDSDPEIDFYGYYTFSTKSGALSLVPGFYLYTYPDARQSDGVYSATFEPSLAAIFSVAGVQLTPKIYYDAMLEGATYEITAAMAVPLTSLGTELDFSATAGTFKWNDVTADATPAVKNWGDYWTIGVAIPVQISLRSKLTVAVTYSEGRNNFYKQGSSPREINDDARGKTAVGLTYSISL